MFFTHDISVQAKEVIFSRKAINAFHPAIFFNDIPVAHCSTHKHSGMHLDETLNFGHHNIIERIVKLNKDIGVIKVLLNVLSHKVLLTIYN